MTSLSPVAQSASRWGRRGAGVKGFPDKHFHFWKCNYQPAFLPATLLGKHCFLKSNCWSTVFPCSWKEASFRFLMEHRGILGSPLGIPVAPGNLWQVSPLLGSWLWPQPLPFIWPLWPERLNSSFLWSLLISPLVGSELRWTGVGGGLWDVCSRGVSRGAGLVKCYLQAAQDGQQFTTELESWGWLVCS